MGADRTNTPSNQLRREPRIPSTWEEGVVVSFDFVHQLYVVVLGVHYRRIFRKVGDPVACTPCMQGVKGVTEQYQRRKAGEIGCCSCLLRSPQPGARKPKGEASTRDE